MRWCTQTEADRPEGEPINYSPPSIIQSRPRALCMCVYGPTHMHTPSSQPSALI